MAQIVKMELRLKQIGVLAKKLVGSRVLAVTHLLF